MLGIRINSKEINEITVVLAIYHQLYINRVNTFPIIYDENTQSHFQTLEHPATDDNTYSELLTDQGTILFIIFIRHLIRANLKREYQ